MKSRASPALIVGLVVLVSAASDAGQTDTAAGPIARAVQREAVRLAETSEIVLQAADSSGPDAKRSTSDWSRVRNLTRGAEVDLTRTGPATRKRHVLRADDTGLTVLNVTDPAIPAAAKDALIRVAADHPDYFLRAQQGERIYLAAAGNLRLTPEGVVQGDRKVADLEQVVETIPREDVAAVGVLSKHVGRHVKRGAIIGAIVGGGLLGLACAGLGCSDEGVQIWVVSAGAGAGYGALFGAIAGGIAPRTMDVIYRAP